MVGITIYVDILSSLDPVLFINSSYATNICKPYDFLETKFPRANNFYFSIAFYLRTRQIVDVLIW